jgi:hypothetical protein
MREKRTVILLRGEFHLEKDFRGMGLRGSMVCRGLLMLLSQYSMAMVVMGMAGPRMASPAVYVVRVKGSPLSAYRGSPELHYASTAHHAPGTNRPDFSRSAASFLSFYSNSLASHFIVRGCQKSKIPVSEQKRFFDTHGFWNDPQLCCVHDEVKQPTHMQSI